MRDRPRFFLSSDHFQGDRITLPADVAHQVSRVLRLGPGDEVVVLDGLGSLCVVSLLEMGPKGGEGRILTREEVRTEPPVPVTLVQSLPKGDRFEWIVQKATELGVARIVPVVTERTVMQAKGDRLAEKLKRWQAIAREAAEQSERGRLPELLPPVDLMEWLSRPATAGIQRLACLERSDVRPLLAHREVLRKAAGIELVIGPEGGFSPGEADQLARTAHPVSLGPRILRTETAAVAAVAIAIAMTEQAPA